MARSDLPIAAIILIGLFAAFAAGQTATAWAPDISYSVGALVTDNGATYQCLQAHLSQADWAPHDTPALWSTVPSTSAAAAATTTTTTTAAPTSSPTVAPATAAPAPSSGNATCMGTPLHVAANIDVCLPHVVCTSEVCPPTLGQCVNGVCQYKPGYSGLQTTPEAWSTYYCTLSTGGCHGVTQIDFPEVTAAKISTALGKPICESYTGTGVCIGIAASSPMVVGNSQVAIDPSTGKEVAKWGMGLTEASGLCYSLTGPGGSAIVALTDRCGGYCKCGGSGFQECGPCVSAADMQPNCPCVGTEDGVECCGLGCATTQQECDWCASNNHPHFDLDIGTFAHVCGESSVLGSCRLSSVTYIPCLTPNPAWPPGGANAGANSASTCPTNQFICNGAAPSAQQPVVPGTSCCCAWGLTPQSDGSCN